MSVSERIERLLGPPGRRSDLVGIVRMLAETLDRIEARVDRLEKRRKPKKAE